MNSIGARRAEEREESEVLRGSPCQGQPAESGAAAAAREAKANLPAGTSRASAGVRPAGGGGPARRNGVGEEFLELSFPRYKFPLRTSSTSAAACPFQLGDASCTSKTPRCFFLLDSLKVFLFQLTPSKR